MPESLAPARIINAIGEQTHNEVPKAYIGADSFELSRKALASSIDTLCALVFASATTLLSELTSSQLSLSR